MGTGDGVVTVGIIGRRFEKLERGNEEELIRNFLEHVALVEDNVEVLTRIPNDGLAALACKVFKS